MLTRRERQLCEEDGNKSMLIAGTAMKCSALLTILALLAWIAVASIDSESTSQEFASRTVSAHPQAGAAGYER